MKSIVLTGGTSKRFGSDKSEASINGKSLLQILTAELEDLIIVGPEREISAKYVQESPLGAGPVAAIGAGMTYVDTELVGIFATDMPFAPKLLNQLKEKLKDDAAIAIDNEGKLQPLAAIYRSAKLREALDSFDTLANKSVKELIAKLNINQVSVAESELLLDIDTQADLLKAIDLASRLAL